MGDNIGKKFLLNGKSKPISAWNDQIFDEPSVIYEVIRVEEGVPLFFNDYFQRLKTSFLLINKSLNISKDQLKSMIQKLLEINGCDSGPVKLLFGGSIESKQSIVYLMEPHTPNLSEYITGVHTILLHKERRNPGAKVWNQPMRDNTNMELKKNNAYEGILVDEEGFITEGSRSNIFFIKEGIVYTTPDEFILSGITRKKVLQLCDTNGIEVKKERIHFTRISAYNAVFITGTSRKVLPVKTIDSIRFSVEDITMQKINILFENLVTDYIREIKGGLNNQ